MSLRGAHAVNITDCFLEFRGNANQTLNATGLVSATGEQVANVMPDILSATGFTYKACLQACGAQTGTPSWGNISQQFGAWLLPYLALISQLPFGARHRVSNLMSAILTVGSPVLAGYSMILTILNARWISRLFQDVTFPNAEDAVRILISLQQTPLRIAKEDSLLSSLIVLHENDDWWSKTAEYLNYMHTWSIASVTSIIWVIIAYLLTVTSSLADVGANINSNGQGTGSVWLWLIPIVIGWLQLSPKCDYARIKKAMDNGNAMAFVATYYGIAKASELSETRAISIDTTVEEPSSPDEDLTPPVYNYARALSWARSAEDVLNGFRMASNNARAHIPVKKDTVWANSDRRNIIEPCNRLGNPYDVDTYCQLQVVRSPWASGMFYRMFKASMLSLALQWATTGAAVLTVWYTPTVGLGCRSLVYLLYGAMSTIVWMMLVLSSILSHYAAYPDQRYTLYPYRHHASHPYRRLAHASYPDRHFPAVRLAKVLANILRWGGKSLAVVNAFCIVTSGMLQFTNVYDNCYCNSSVLGLGVDYAYAIVFPSYSQVHQTTVAWGGALVLGCGGSVVFIFFIYLLIDFHLE
ncbi:hypothetical protein K503DRAFT_841407 [Rhizopogon vinicolor AM-OR11-026]|uniref:Uncharacterized protein n=1 Tax=Rhizopogon vinicolor AM-OR11-026 TaxID=1314800 RepID=A0A1B7N7D9_9AGAM|nr:hypothetical protein K503DRAFT_841407 [Rhizopogon vinicolor AM-OR11-026]